MWKIKETYLQLRAMSGYRYDVDDLASAVSTALAQDDSPRRYTHIVIDEGQDLSSEMIRSLTRAIPDTGSLNFFERCGAANIW